MSKARKEVRRGGGFIGGNGPRSGGCCGLKKGGGRRGLEGIPPASTHVVRKGSKEKKGGERNFELGVRSKTCSGGKN